MSTTDQYETSGIAFKEGDGVSVHLARWSKDARRIIVGWEPGDLPLQILVNGKLVYDSGKGEPPSTMVKV